ncbi:Phosphoribosyltransferase-like [Phytophthora cactorum]|nr:Phosphoribosyltransferase-like [Phytophthora cactorum]
MFLRAVRSHAKLGAAALMGAPVLLSQQEAHAEQRCMPAERVDSARHDEDPRYENAGAKFTHDANGVLRSTLDLALTELPNDERYRAVVTTPRGYKAEGLVFEDDVKVCGIICCETGGPKGLSDELILTASTCSLSQVLHTSLPYDAKFGEILVQEVAKAIAKANVPDDLDGHEVLLLLPELASVAQAHSEGHIVPGIGSFEERYLGAPSSVVDVIDEAEDTGIEENALKAKITAKISSWFKKD